MLRLFIPKRLPQLRCSMSSSNSAAYAGDGKTTVRILNEDEPRINLINSYSAHGFRLANNLFIAGSILLFPTHVFSWSVRQGQHITMDSLIVFDLIVPKTKILVIGYGRQGEPYDASIPMALKKRGISCEMLPTPHAVTTYNFLVSDALHVAGAFVPVREDIISTEKDRQALLGMDKIIKGYEVQPPDDYEREGWDYLYERAKETKEVKKPISPKKQLDDDR